MEDNSPVSYGTETNEILWSTGITVHFIKNYGWSAKLDWFSNDRHSEGSIFTSSPCQTVSETIDLVMRHVDSIGIVFPNTEAPVPMLFYSGDGENKDEMPPENWRTILNQEAQKRGWISYKVDEPGFECYYDPIFVTPMRTDEGLFVKDEDWVVLPSNATRDELEALLTSEYIIYSTKDFPSKEKSRRILLQKVRNMEEPLSKLWVHQIFNRFGTTYPRKTPYGANS